MPWKEISVVPACDCLEKIRKKQEEESRREEMMGMLRRRGFETGKYARMKIRNFSNQNMETNVIDAIGDYINSVNFKTRNWLYLHGDNGLGKTFMAVASAREIALLRLWSPALFRWAEVCSLIQQSWQDREVKIEWNLLRDAGILVLDDIDKKAATPWALGQLYDVLDYRQINELPTIITANRSISELSNFWNKSKETEDLSKAIISRIMGQVVKMIHFKGSDYRLYGN